MGDPMKNLTGFVFARGGSKGVPGKNLCRLNGKPLVGIAVETGLESRYIDTMIVSTDSREIADAALKHGAEVPFMRPDDLAGDTSPEWLAWRHAIAEMERMGRPLDVFISLPATSPLRATDDIDACISLYMEGGCDMVITATETTRHPAFNMVTDDDEGYSRLVMPPVETISRRQDAPVVYDMTTVAYVADPNFIMTNNSIFEGRVKSVLIPEERALDIDTEFDLKIAELFMRERSGTSGEN